MKLSISLLGALAQAQDNVTNRAKRHDGLSDNIGDADPGDDIR